jgi:ligand-binding SRPBCC domain-containing protein
MKTHVLSRKQFIPLAVREVFPFFESPENLGSITPAWLRFRITTPLTVEMRAGTVIDYTISWMGIPLRWRTLIDRYDPPHEFVDVQLKGPYALWRHTHRFLEVKGGTEMTDTVCYALPFGPIGSLVHTLALRAQLERIFDHRASALARRFGAGRNGSEVGIDPSIGAGTESEPIPGTGGTTLNE